MKTALEFLVAVRFVRSVGVASKRSWTVRVVQHRHRHEVWLLVLAALAVLLMRRWLEVSFLVLLALVVPQMHHFELAPLVLVQVGQR